MTREEKRLYKMSEDEKIREAAIREEKMRSRYKMREEKRLYDERR